MEDSPEQSTLIMICQEVEDFNPEILKILAAESERSAAEIVAFLFDDDSIEYVENIHPDPTNYFLISPERAPTCDYILFHSHVKKGGFSDWDLQNQRYHDKSMLLYDKIDKKFYYRACK